MMRRSIRDYLLTLFLGVVVFAVAAFFLLRAAEGLMLDVVDKIGSEGETLTETSEEVLTQEPSAPVNGEVAPPATQEDVTATFLFMGIDQSGKNADAIFLVGINATKKKATVALIPSNTLVTEGTKKQELGELYGSRSPNFFKEFIAKETGITPDYYMAMSMSGLSNLIDFLGGISYNVPENMYYFDPTQNLKINLRAGKQTLTGDQALQLVAYRGYAGGDTAREDTQLGFVRAFCSAFLNPDHLSRAKSIMYNVYYHVETDFEEVDLNELGEVIFNFPAYNSEFIRIPGAASGEFYGISTSRSTSMFEIYQ